MPSSFDDGRVGWLEPEIKNVPGQRRNMLTMDRRSGHALAARSAAADTGFVSIWAVRAFLGALLDQTLRSSAGTGADGLRFHHLLKVLSDDALATSMGREAVRFVAEHFSLAVLSRLLPPSDYGVMAMAGVVMVLAAMLRDMGTGAAIIQRKELTPELTSTVFWMNVGLGLMLGLALWGFSGLLGGFFREPKLPGVLMLVSVMFPLTSLTTVHQAIIERRSGFRTLAFLDVLNQVVGLALAIGAALSGAGVYSLVVPGLSSTVISTVWLWSQSGWRPAWRWSNTEFKGLWSFSGNLTTFQFVVYFARNADSMIIGRMLGSAPLGIYSMAYKLMLFPVQNLTWVVGRVLMPRMCQLQDDRERIRELYFKALGAVVMLSAPAMAGLWALREPFVALAFGPRWADVPELVAWLAPVGLLQSMTSTVGTVFMAAGRTRTLFRLGLANTAVIMIGRCRSRRRCVCRPCSNAPQSARPEWLSTCCHSSSSSDSRCCNRRWHSSDRGRDSTDASRCDTSQHAPRQCTHHRWRGR